MRSTSERAGIHHSEPYSVRGVVVRPEIERLLCFAIVFVSNPGLQRCANYLGIVFALNDKTSTIKNKKKDDEDVSHRWTL